MIYIIKKKCKHIEEKNIITGVNKNFYQKYKRNAVVDGHFFYCITLTKKNNASKR